MMFDRISMLISIIVCSNMIPIILSMKPLQTRAMTRKSLGTSTHTTSRLGCSCAFCTNIYRVPQSNKVRSSSLTNSLIPPEHSSMNPFIDTLQNIEPRSRELSELFTQKSNFAFSEEEEEAHHIDNLLINNREWVEDMIKFRPEEYRKLAENQTPKYLYFGCSDSRVPVNQVLGLGPGEVFVHRNVGNLVPGNDLNVLSVLEFAVDHLGVTDILVTGHYNCGAVKAAVTRQDLGMLENWLRSIRDVYRIHRDYLDRIVDDKERHMKLVELNVVEQCINIFKTGIVQRKRLENSQTNDYELKNAPRIHGLVFDTSEGLLHRLNVDYSRVGSLDSIYRLY